MSSTDPPTVADRIAEFRRQRDLAIEPGASSTDRRQLIADGRRLLTLNPEDLTPTDWAAIRAYLAEQPGDSPDRSGDPAATQRV